MVVLLGADLVCDELVVWSARLRLASCNEIGTRPADGVFDEVGYEERKNERYEPSEDGDVGFVGARAHDDGPHDEGTEGNSACVDEEPSCLKLVLMLDLE